VNSRIESNVCQYLLPRALRHGSSARYFDLVHGMKTPKAIVYAWSRAPSAARHCAHRAPVATTVPTVRKWLRHFEHYDPYGFWHFPALVISNP
jgi:hypothetical protein